MTHQAAPLCSPLSCAEVTISRAPTRHLRMGPKQWPATGVLNWQLICGFAIRGGAKAFATMSHHSVSHFLSDRFPDLGQPRYQSVLETISFLIVTAMIAGAFAIALFLLFYEL